MLQDNKVPKFLSFANNIPVATDGLKLETAATGKGETSVCDYGEGGVASAYGAIGTLAASASEMLHSCSPAVLYLKLTECLDRPDAFDSTREVSIKARKILNMKKQDLLSCSSHSSSTHSIVALASRLRMCGKGPVRREIALEKGQIEIAFSLACFMAS